MEDTELTNGDPEFLASVLNAATGKGVLPEGVKIMQQLDINAEVKNVFDALKQSPTFAEDTKDIPNIYEYQIEESLSGVKALEAYTIVTDEAGHGIAALPTLIILFEAGGDAQIINSDPVWFVFATVEIADEMVLQTQELVESMFPDEEIEEEVTTEE